MDNVIEFDKKPKPTGQCSFCGKSEAAVKKLFSGAPGVFICGSCVTKCTHILGEGSG